MYYAKNYIKIKASKHFLVLTNLPKKVNALVLRSSAIVLKGGSELKKGLDTFRYGAGLGFTKGPPIR